MLRGAGAGGSAASHFVCLEKSFFTTIGCGLAGTGSLLAGAVLMIAGVGFARAGLGFGSTETSSGCWAGLSLTSTCFGGVDADCSSGGSGAGGITEGAGRTTADCSCTTAGVSPAVHLLPSMLYYLN